MSLYHVLGLNCTVENDPNCDQIIKSAFFQKSHLFHPDKHPNNEEMKLNFQKIVTAYQTLKTASARQVYRLSLIDPSSDYQQLKSNFDHYLDDLSLQPTVPVALIKPTNVAVCALPFQLTLQEIIDQRQHDLENAVLKNDYAVKPINDF